MVIQQIPPAVQAIVVWAWRNKKTSVTREEIEKVLEWFLDDAKNWHGTQLLVGSMCGGMLSSDGALLYERAGEGIKKAHCQLNSAQVCLDLVDRDVAVRLDNTFMIKAWARSQAPNMERQLYKRHSGYMRVLDTKAPHVEAA